VKLKNPACTASVLAALGIDSMAGSYRLSGNDLLIDGVTDAEIKAAESALNMSAILAENQAQAVQAVNAAAEAARMAYLPSFGQTFVYQEKEAQARAYQAAGFVGIVPKLVAQDVSAGLAVDAKAAALAIIAAADVARANITAIEGERRRGIAAIKAANSFAEIDNVNAAALAALAAL